MAGWPFIDSSMARIFGFLRFDVFHVYIADPVVDDLIWKNAASSAYNFQLVQTKLKDLLEDLRDLEKKFQTQAIPSYPTNIFKHLFAKV